MSKEFERSDRYGAYYYSFVPTGCEEVDAILREVANAGKSYHNTSDWNDDGWDGQTPVAKRIQIVANESADKIKKLKVRDEQK